MYFDNTDEGRHLRFDDAAQAAADARDAISTRSRTGSMVLLPDTAAPLWIDEADYAAMSVLSENARSGRPKLGAIFEEELEMSDGAMLVASELRVDGVFFIADAGFQPAARRSSTRSCATLCRGTSTRRRS
jgi:hypothetical protein